MNDPTEDALEAIRKFLVEYNKVSKRTYKIEEEQKKYDERRRKKNLRRMEQITHSLEDANYHSECAMMCDLWGDIEKGSIKDLDELMEWFWKYPEWRSLR